MKTRWRFHSSDHGAIIEVETEPTVGFNLTTGKEWTGTHVKARYAFGKSKRWTRANLVDTGPNEKRAAEIVADRILVGSA